ncbi:MAG: MFS transporter [Reyranellaceae bacterium]
MGNDSGTVGWSALLRPRWIPAVVVLVGGILLHSMNVLMLATVLPSVVDDIHGAALISWTSTAYLASSIIAATCTGYLTSNIGARSAFCIGALMFGAGALICALAPAMAQIVVGRFVQGFGGGLLAAIAYVLVRNTFPSELWPRAFTLLSGTWSLAIVVGPLVGGVFAQYASWRGAFFSVAGLAVVLAAVAYRALSAGAANAGARRPPGLRIVLVSAAIAIMSCTAIAPHVLAKAGLVVAAVGLLVLTLAIDRRSATRLLPSDAFSPDTITGLGLWLTLMVSISYSPLQIFMPIFLQSLHGLDPLSSGYMVAGGSFGWTIVSLVVAGLAAPTTDRLLIAGPVMMGIGLIGMAVLVRMEPAIVVFPAIFMLGAGIGSCWAFIAQRVMTGARAGEEDVAASSMATVQQTGFALGAAVSGLVANAVGLSGGLNRTDVSQAALWVPTSFVLAALVAAAVGMRLSRRQVPAR